MSNRWWGRLFAWYGKGISTLTRTPFRLKVGYDLKLVLVVVPGVYGCFQLHPPSF